MGIMAPLPIRQVVVGRSPASRVEGTMIGFIIGLLVIGLVAGFLARAIVPGNDSMGIVPTVVLGVVGSYVGGLLVGLLTRGDDTFGPAGWIGSIVGAIVVLLAYNAITGRKRVHR